MTEIDIKRENFVQRILERFAGQIEAEDRESHDDYYNRVHGATFKELTRRELIDLFEAGWSSNDAVAWFRCREEIDSWKQCEHCGSWVKKPDEEMLSEEKALARMAEIQRKYQKP